MTKKETLRYSNLQRIGVLFFATIWIATSASSFAYAQVSPAEHAKHHPNQAKGDKKKKGGKGNSGGMMNGKGGGMGKMMEKMGAPKPKEIYPKLMDLPDLPLEERDKIKQQAHQRMIEGTKLLSTGLGELSSASAIDDFQSMQSATAKMREGLAQFESGLAAHRAIAEGKAPRNVAIQWFKREMNLLPPVGAKPEWKFFGMTLFHTSIMVLLIVFTVAMIWMYFFKMRRAAALLEKLTEAGSTATNATSTTSNIDNPSLLKPSATIESSSVATTASNGMDDCCRESATDCAGEESAIERSDISKGLLNIAKRKLCRMRVARIYQETADVKTFRLVACHGGGQGHRIKTTRQ